MPLTQLKITKFFKPAKLPEHIKQLRKIRKAKAATTPVKPTATKPAPKPATQKYTPPHKRTLPASKSKPQAQTQNRPSAPLAPKPATPDSTKGKKSEQLPIPQNEPILAFLSSHVSPKFIFPKDSRPTFSVLFPGTSRPKVTMLHGTPTIDKAIFNTLLRSRIAAAHTVLRTAKLDRARLPKSFVSSQIHLIQSSLRTKNKVKKEVSSPQKDKKSKAPAALNPAKPSAKKQKTPNFVPASNDPNDTPSSAARPGLSNMTTAKLRASDIQTSESADTHALITTIRDRRHLIALAVLTESITKDSAPKIESLVADCLSTLSIPSFTFRCANSEGHDTYELTSSGITASTTTHVGLTSAYPNYYLYGNVGNLIRKIDELATLATRI